MEAFDCIKTEHFKAELFFDDDPVNPRKEYDFDAVLVFESWRHTLSDKDEYSDCPMLRILWKIDDVVADRLERIITWRSYRTFKGYGDKSREEQRRISKEFDAWQDALLRKYVDATGTAYEEFSLAGSYPHRGVAYIPADKVKASYKGDVEFARKAIRSEIKVIDHWLEGEVYGFKVHRKDCDEEIDSCWGFFGKESLLESANYALQHQERLPIENQAPLRVYRELMLA